MSMNIKCDSMIFCKNARDDAASALEQLHDVEREVKSLQTVTQRMILTHEEMVSTT